LRELPRAGALNDEIGNAERSTRRHTTSSAMIGSSLFSLFLIGLSGWMLDLHRRGRQRVREQASRDPVVHRFATAQYRRRMLASGFIGVLGAAIAIAPLVPRRPWPMAIYLVVLAVGWCWIVAAAFMDVVATRRHYRRLRQAASDTLLRELPLRGTREASEPE
jgi:MFS family permease